MNSVVLKKGGQKLTLIEGGGTVPGIVTLIAEDADVLPRAIVLSLDHADMAALIVFHRAYQLGRIHLTPGGDAETEGGD